MIAQAHLKAVLNYDPESGHFTWRKALSNRVKANSRAGGPHNEGYVSIAVNGRRFLAHRLAWFYVHGTWPKEIDHINGKRSDNRISNLREATRSQNNANAKVRSNNRSGMKGVSWSSDRKMWVAHISWQRKVHHLGRFKTKEAAQEAYLAKASELFGNFHRPQ